MIIHYPQFLYSKTIRDMILPTEILSVPYQLIAPLTVSPRSGVSGTQFTWSGAQVRLEEGSNDST